MLGLVHFCADSEETHLRPFIHFNDGLPRYLSYYRDSGAFLLHSAILPLRRLPVNNTPKRKHTVKGRVFSQGRSRVLPQIHRNFHSSSS
jgi:hypothetical protein